MSNGLRVPKTATERQARARLTLLAAWPERGDDGSRPSPWWRHDTEVSAREDQQACKASDAQIQGTPRPRPGVGASRRTSPQIGGIRDPPAQLCYAGRRDRFPRKRFGNALLSPSEWPAGTPSSPTSPTP